MSIIESARVVQWLGCHASNVKIRVQFPAPAFIFSFYIKKLEPVLEHELINNRGEYFFPIKSQILMEKHYFSIKESHKCVSVKD